MPLFFIYDFEWDDKNQTHATSRATREQIESVLGGRIEAKPNKKGGTARYSHTGTAADGTRWRVLFNYDNGTTRPITAIPVKK